MTAPARDPRGARYDLALVAALAVLSVAVFAQATLTIDSGRDLASGWAIARGLEFPATGPSLNGLWRPGPAWYWLLGTLLWLGASIGATTTAVGALAAAKIPLAWLLGRRLHGPAFGLALAAAIALPGWATLGQLVLSHTSLVESGVLATLWLALRAQQRACVGSALGAALMLGLALHAHPTALVAAPALAWVAWRWPASRVRAWLVPAFAVAFVLPFAPMLVAEAQAGWPQWQASTGYFGHSDYLARALRAPAVLWGATGGEVGFVFALMERTPWLAGVVAVTLGAVFVLAALGVARGWRESAMRCAAGFALGCWLFVLLLRDTTSAWMVYACAPAGALLLASGWQRLAGTRALLAARVLAALALGCGALLLANRIATVRAGLQAMPAAAIVDVAQPAHPDPLPRLWLPAWGHDAAARRLCAEASTVAVHADLAMVLNLGQGVAIERHCGAREVRLGGAAGRSLAGVPRAVADALGIEGDEVSWGYVLVPTVDALSPSVAAPVASHTRYLIDDYLQHHALHAVTTTRLQASCGEHDLLVATNLVPQLNAPFAVEAPTLPQPAARTHASDYFACPRGALELELRVRVPEAGDVFVLRRDALSADRAAR